MMTDTKILLITPPFTQLNTPYPATAYLKGFLNTQNIPSFQLDLGIEVLLQLFSKSGIEQLFERVKLTASQQQLTPNALRMLQLSHYYIQTIDPVIAFLQDCNPTLAHSICTGNYLPEADRFQQVADLEWAFGAMGIRDKARHLVTLYLEDLSDLIVEAVDPLFGFSRYAERLGRSAGSFDQLQHALDAAPTFIDQLLFELLAKYLQEQQPKVVALSVPFPGNLYSAFRCGQWIKQHYPDVRLILGGGYANTELRSISDARVFKYIDFVCLDDGEAPILNLLEYIDGNRPIDFLKRTFGLLNGQVHYFNASLQPDYKQVAVGTPDYSDLLLQRYLSVIEVANPMHRLWSDGRWNKLTLAHGCYWGKCTFCDISLDYIANYEATTASVLVDRMETIITQTGQTGFHFVDEAAPPALMREVALEIIRRKLTIVWWTNIRFEKSFTADLCHLLAASGCIAVSGGLEVASDRLLTLIQKGVTVAQVANVAANFTNSGIMVHAYLMYGFPTQTTQETVDALEMVRQMFELGVVQSGFWHQFAMTAHSPVGKNPEAYGVKALTQELGSFANNDLEHFDPVGNHERFSNGLKKSLFNYMHGLCFDFDLQEWFDFKIPATRIPSNFIENALTQGLSKAHKPSAKVVWIGGHATLTTHVQHKKGKQLEQTLLRITAKSEDAEIPVSIAIGNWLVTLLPLISVTDAPLKTLQFVKTHFEDAGLGNFEHFLQHEVFEQLSAEGFLVL